jgi:hypothetical protein
MKHDPVEIARLFAFVREAQDEGQNRGLRVEAIQHWSKGAPGDSWCAEFATMVLDLAFAGNAPIDRQGSCEAIRRVAAQAGWITDTPQVGDLFLYVNATGNAHHIGFVTQTDPLMGIAGNTSSDGTSSNGDGVYEHGIAASVFVHYPR